MTLAVTQCVRCGVVWCDDRRTAPARHLTVTAGLLDEPTRPSARTRQQMTDTDGAITTRFVNRAVEKSPLFVKRP